MPPHHPREVILTLIMIKTVIIKIPWIFPHQKTVNYAEVFPIN